MANLGLAYNETGRPRDGLTALDRALALDDKQALIWCNKGYALDDLKRYDEALAAYERALAIDPKFLKAWYNKATTLYTKLYNESLAAHERGFDSTDRRDWNLRARTLRALGRTREAMEAERRAEELGG